MKFINKLDEKLKIEFPNIIILFSEESDASDYTYKEAGKILNESGIKYDEMNLTDDGIFIDGEFNQEIITNNNQSINNS